MTLDERSGLVLAFARILFVNGQAAEQAATAAERLGRALGTACQAHAALGRVATSIP